MPNLIYFRCLKQSYCEEIKIELPVLFQMVNWVQFIHLNAWVFFYVNKIVAF